MKNILALFIVLLFSSPIMAAEQWMCTGYGTINTGGPGGPIVIPVHGTGSTEFEAMSNAQQNCRMQGLQMCMINSCYKTN